MKKILLIALILSATLAGLSAQIRTGQSYYIQSAQAAGTIYGMWDFSGSDPRYKKGEKLGLYQLETEKNRDRKFTFIEAGNGYYYIMPSHARSEGYIDLPANENNNGVQMIIWDINNGPAQKFKVEHQGNGRFKIFTNHSRILCTPRDYGNGQPVQTWDNHDGEWCEWLLLDNTLKKYVPGKFAKEPVHFKALKKFYYGGSNKDEGTATVKLVAGNTVTLMVKSNKKGSWPLILGYDNQTGEYLYKSKEGTVKAVPSPIFEGAGFMLWFSGSELITLMEYNGYKAIQAMNK